MGRYFGTDGFRGRAGKDLTAVHAFKVGRFLGSYLEKGKRTRVKIALGKDTRLSSYTFEYALAAGATAAGADVYLLHVTTTPSVSFVTRTEGFDCGVMISASHNPYYDNGIKLLNGEGEKMEESTIALLEDYLDGGTSPFATDDGVGRTIDFVAGRNRYLAYLLSLPRASFRGLRIGLDCANGSSWSLAKTVFDALGAKVYAIGVQPNGVNINAECGSTHPEKLSALVREQSLDMGFAFDGDGDRCILVDERGEIVDGDGILYLLALGMKAAGETVSGVAAAITSNTGLVRSLDRENISVHLTEVGDKAVYEEMQKNNLPLGGEYSGHIILSKYARTGDGILTALKICETARERKCPVSYLLKGYTPLVRKTENIEVKNKRAVCANAKVLAVLAEAEALLGGGRMLLRPSGTENVVRVLAEGESERACSNAVSLVSKAVRGVGEEL